MTLRKATDLRRVLPLAAVLLVFAVFHPYLDADGLCGEAGCPHVVQSHAPASAEFPSAALAVISVAVTSALVQASTRRPWPGS